MYIITCIYVSFPIQIEEESFVVRLYDSEVEESSSMDSIYVCLSDRFLEERNFGSGKVSTEFNITVLYFIYNVCCSLILIGCSQRQGRAYTKRGILV